MRVRVFNVLLGASMSYAAIAMSLWAFRTPVPSGSGTWVPPATLNEQALSIVGRPGAEFMLVEVLSVDCVWSRTSIAGWNALRDSLSSKASVRVVTLSFSPISESEPFVDERRLVTDTLVYLPAPLLRGWGIDRTPITLLVDSRGAVLRGFSGAVEEWQVQQIVQDFRDVIRARESPPPLE